MPSIQVIYEDNNFLAVNKPAGLLVHGFKVTVDGEKKHIAESTLVDWLLEKYPEIKGVGDLPRWRSGIVHRLDKQTSGVLLLAKNQEYFIYLKNLFKNHEVEKTYLALVKGRVEPKEGFINKPIGLKPGTVKRTVFVKNAKMIKEALTEYKVKEYLPSPMAGLPEYSLLEVKPKTGRTHQIRVHLASIGHAVVGDPLYGGGKVEGFNRLFLHAYSLEFSPVPGKKLKLTADLPPDLTQFLSSAKLASQ
ncbi:MAG: hypothetical protein A3D47_01690 [Candidatus Colwellbacteria bacterium RIFCSPHIGHO2_02_FULL_43_15]|uniref:Pseudouridine synthase RsuA/RluA-like domain-containing protein n=1 Tax=Candidatus Colwellbacteria bacterium RIFCSPHIGHO2_02_FULL_43_15 TaxID=1797686 RepID=A0A1G1YZZ5_9BACT|nr:MAG: hypothetical protein A3D47_01690 [Candidatus Colwellbacteria bacterium RIFCSPHIGHO2_02_FULL_43_15]